MAGTSYGRTADTGRSPPGLAPAREPGRWCMMPGPPRPVALESSALPRLQTKSFATPDDGPDDAEGALRHGQPRRRDGGALRLRAGVALVGRPRAGHGDDQLPDAPPRLHDDGVPAGRDGRRRDARHRPGLRLRHPAGPRQVGPRRRTVGDDRVGRERPGDGRGPGGVGRRPLARHGHVHRHRRLDGDPGEGRRRGLACAPARARRAAARGAQRLSRSRDQVRPATGSSPSSTARRVRSAAPQR